MTRAKSAPPRLIVWPNTRAGSLASVPVSRPTMNTPTVKIADKNGDENAENSVSIENAQKNAQPALRLEVMPKVGAA